MPTRKLPQKTCPIQSIQAVLWDMDGVLADSKELHLQAWRQICEIYHIAFTPALFGSFFGQSNPAIVEKLLQGTKRRLTQVQKDQVCQEKERLYRESARTNLVPTPGVKTWLDFLMEHSIPCAVASSAPMANIVMAVQTLGLADYFQALISGATLPAGKPDPAIFLRAAAALATDPARCLVIEDSPVGVQAAKSAGMLCLGLTTTNAARVLELADWVYPNLAVARPEEIFRFARETLALFGGS